MGINRTDHAFKPASLSETRNLFRRNSFNEKLRNFCKWKNNTIDVGRGSISDLFKDTVVTFHLLNSGHGE